MSDPSPLSIKDITLIDASNLTQLEKHHIRILAHCLFSFKEMAEASKSGSSLPNQTMRLNWCINQPKIKKDKSFIDALLKEFDSAAKQLEHIATEKNIPPLELNISDLIKFAQESHQEKIISPQNDN